MAGGAAKFWAVGVLPTIRSPNEDDDRQNAQDGVRVAPLATFCVPSGGKKKLWNAVPRRLKNFLICCTPLFLRCASYYPGDHLI